MSRGSVALILRTLSRAILGGRACLAVRLTLLPARLLLERWSNDTRARWTTIVGKGPRCSKKVRPLGNETHDIQVEYETSAQYSTSTNAITNYSCRASDIITVTTPSPRVGPLRFAFSSQNIADILSWAERSAFSETAFQFDRLEAAGEFCGPRPEYRRGATPCSPKLMNAGV